MRGDTMKGFRKIPGALWVLLAVILILFAISSRAYYLTLFVFCGIYVIAVSGLDILFGYSGQISLGHAAFFAMGSYVSAILAVSFGTPVFLCILIGSAASTLLGFVVAVPASRLINMFLSLLTVAFGQMAYTFAKQAEAVTGGTGGIKRIPKPGLFGYEISSNMEFAVLILLICVVMLFVKHRIVNSSTGRALMSIRENVVAANGIGIHVSRYKITAFMISAFYTGLGGALYAHYVGYIGPETFTATQSQLFLTMLLFGGSGNLLGPVIGAVILSLINETLAGFSNYRNLIYGFVVLIAVLFMPRGLFGLGRDLLFRARRKLDAGRKEVGQNA